MSSSIAGLGSYPSDKTIRENFGDCFLEENGMTWRFTILLLMVLSGCSSSKTERGTIAKVLDGRTLELADGRLLRLAGLETPHCGEAKDRSSVEDKEVRRFLEEQVLQQQVEFTYNPGATQALGHLAAQVRFGAHHINLELLERGYARYFTKYGTIQEFHKAFEAAEHHAREAGAGFWKDGRFATTCLHNPMPSFLEGKFVGSGDLHFHAPECLEIQGEPRLTVLEDLAQARKEAYSPCPRCLPELAATWTKPEAAGPR